MTHGYTVVMVCFGTAGRHRKDSCFRRHHYTINEACFCWDLNRILIAQLSELLLVQPLGPLVAVEEEAQEEHHVPRPLSPQLVR